MPGKFRKSVFIVVYAKTNEGIKYLLLKRKLHSRGWEFAKGGIDLNESTESAAKRDTLEETGKTPINIKDFNFHGSYKYRRSFADRKEFIGQEFSLFGIEVEYGEAKIDNHEHSGYEWLSFNGAMRRLKFPNQKKSLKIVGNWLKQQ